MSTTTVVRATLKGSVETGWLDSLARALEATGATDLTYGPTPRGCEIEFVGDAAHERALKRAAWSQRLSMQSMSWTMAAAGTAASPKRHLRLVPTPSQPAH